MLVTHDDLADAAYIYIDNEGEVSHTIEVRKNVNIDVDSLGNVLGIEILDESHQKDILDAYIDQYTDGNDLVEHVHI